MATKKGYNRRYKLTWMATTKRWRKKHKGKLYYFPIHDGETKEASYGRCLAAWTAKKAELDLTEQSRQNAEWERYQHYLGVILRWARENDDVQGWEALDRSRQAALAAQGQGLALPDVANRADIADLPGEVLDIVPTRPKVRPWNTQEDQPNVQSLGGAVVRFLALRQAEADAGKLSLGRVRNLRQHAEDFAGVVGSDLPAAEIGGEHLDTYYASLLARVAGKTFGKARARDAWQATKQLVRWLWESGVVADLPRNFATKNMRFTVAARQVEVVETETLKAFLAEVTGRSRLYAMLVANCGFAAADIGTLAPGEVDWDAGRITRRRTKTARHENPPTVCFKLWGETARLLAEYRGADPERVLLSHTGKPLWAERREGDKVTLTDGVRQCLRDWARRNDWKEYPTPRQIRRTCASLLGNRFGDDTAKLWLGHAAAGMAAKHYLAVDPTRLDEPIGWLGDQLGVE